MKELRDNNQKKLYKDQEDFIFGDIPSKNSTQMLNKTNELGKSGSTNFSNIKLIDSNVRKVDSNVKKMNKPIINKPSIKKPKYKDDIESSTDSLKLNSHNKILNPKLNNTNNKLTASSEFNSSNNNIDNNKLLSNLGMKTLPSKQVKINLDRINNNDTLLDDLDINLMDFESSIDSIDLKEIKEKKYHETIKQLNKSLENREIELIKDDDRIKFDKKQEDLQRQYDNEVLRNNLNFSNNLLLLDENRENIVQESSTDNSKDSNNKSKQLRYKYSNTNDSHLYDIKEESKSLNNTLNKTNQSLHKVMKDIKEDNQKSNIQEVNSETSNNTNKNKKKVNIDINNVDNFDYTHTN